ncbi:hypothetical protein G7K_1817-t1 [Saitoella complicata NRRL Y-17804]|uniref:T6SS Phospholipase effector Tle1-like catalytic domain-containing protein n=1 Tax=Saitoella complicata (strain BCRC 22490 / CBS 7301 / JCM 7358 / NBRC 10748 / NRRL Y-17804) TaxID=698492 RepID=A0A0E9NCM3_SAICN|nr:hypothetical protein G7K_1817-t1 [Saitoella complicata NRRL Y-17804]
MIVHSMASYNPAFAANSRPALKKRIIVCCDGTSQDELNLPRPPSLLHTTLGLFASSYTAENRLREEQFIHQDTGRNKPDLPWYKQKLYNFHAGKVKPPSNITLLARAIKKTAIVHGEKIPQIVFYQPGIGTTGLFFSRFFQETMAKDMGYKVRQAYSYIVQNYDEGDEIFLFGFSRGAFTARSVAGFIEWAGVLQKEHMSHFDELWYEYKSEGENSNHTRAERFRVLDDPKRHFETRYRNVNIRCVGVFDTVAALGVPSLRHVDDEDVPEAAREAQAFFDVDLGEHVDYAFQALALDEHRRDFYPAVWKILKPEYYKARTKNIPQVVEQTWFTGAHSDIGGSYLIHGLSDVTLKWMVDNCDRNGLLEFDHKFLESWYQDSRPAEQYLHTPHDSSYSFGLRHVNRHPGLFPPSGEETEDKDYMYIRPSQQRLHQSVIERLRMEGLRVIEGRLHPEDTYLETCTTLKKWGLDMSVLIDRCSDSRGFIFPPPEVEKNPGGRAATASDGV